MAVQRGSDGEVHFARLVAVVAEAFVEAFHAVFGVVVAQQFAIPVRGLHAVEGVAAHEGREPAVFFGKRRALVAEGEFACVVADDGDTCAAAGDDADDAVAVAFGKRYQGVGFKDFRVFESDGSSQVFEGMAFDVVDGLRFDAVAEHGVVVDGAGRGEDGDVAIGVVCAVHGDLQGAQVGQDVDVFAFGNNIAVFNAHEAVGVAVAFDGDGGERELHHAGIGGERDSAAGDLPVLPGDEVAVLVNTGDAAVSGGKRAVRGEAVGEFVPGFVMPLPEFACIVDGGDTESVVRGDLPDVANFFGADVEQGNVLRANGCGGTKG